MSNFSLTPQQLQVINALSIGTTVTLAAQEAGVHRNTINHWRRNSIPFRNALADAQYDRALYFREHVEDLMDTAIQTLRDLLVDPQAPPSVRLKAALSVIQTAIAPPEPNRQSTLEIQSVQLQKSAQTVPPPTLPEKAAAEPEPESEIVHNFAQPITSKPPVQPDAATYPSKPPCAMGRYRSTPSCSETHRLILPSSHVEGEDISQGRNDPCPCGSGQKYKRCCLNKPKAAAA
jgi:hypothetical protein